MSCPAVCITVAVAALSLSMLSTAECSQNEPPLENLLARAVVSQFERATFSINTSTSCTDKTSRASLRI